MFLKEEIKRRVSIRDFLDTEIEPKKFEDLNELIERYNKTQGIRFELVNDSNTFATFTESYGIFKNVKNFIVAIKEVGNDDAEEKLGYYGELLVLYAVAYGLGTCYVGVRDKLKGLEYYDYIPEEFKNAKNPTVKLAENEEIVCLIAFGNTKYNNEELKVLNDKRTSKTYDEFTFISSYTDIEPEWFKDGIAAAMKAPSLYNVQPIQFIYDKNMMFAKIVNHNDGLAYLDLGIAKLHFEIGAEGGIWQWGDNGSFIKM